MQESLQCWHYEMSKRGGNDSPPSELLGACSLYIECADGTGTLEWNTANDTLVKFHDTLIGVVTGAPADDMIFVGNQGKSLAVLVQPGSKL